MSYSSTNPAPESNPAPSPAFTAQSQMGLAEVLQMCCLSRRSGQITFRSEESYGYVFIQQGQTLHAMCGVVEGEEAVYLMLSWPGGSFTLDEDILPHKRTISLTWEQLLFEGARRADVGLLSPKAGTGGPIKTADPLTSTRQESQPKLTVTRPDLPPIVHLLEEEYTHVGRAAGNEIPLPYPSVSSRHCIFILSGTDIVLRDLNSSNGTLVNGVSITETILRPGDEIQVGTVVMKFEPGIKRPKLSSTVAPTQVSAPKEVPISIDRIFSQGTQKLPPLKKTTGKIQPVPDDNAFVKGHSAISYDNLPKPEEKPASTPWMLIGIGTVVVFAILGGVYYYFFVMHAAH